MEFDYQNSSLSSPEVNSLGDELNQSVLKDSESTAGARDFSYSNKNSGESTAKTQQNVQKITEQQATMEATSTSVGTTVGTSAAVGGVVIATVVIFTSLLGNQFKLVDDSLALSLYRDNETNQVNLDYSFDLQYDKSGSVYVKLISASHNLTSEEYKIVYKGQEQEIIEYEEGEDVPSEEKTKDIYSITIEGSFYSLREKNEYTFAITSVIDGVESSIYTRNIYIPSTYVDVVEGGSYYYQDEESKANLISYFYQVEYESNAKAYVELKHVSSNGDFSIIETSEVYLLDTSDPEMQIEDTNRYMTFIEGTFSSSVINHDEYIVSLITTSGGHTNVAYTERFIVDIEDIPPVDEHEYSFVVEPTVRFTSYYGTLFLEYEAVIASEYDGTVTVNIYDEKETQLYTRIYDVTNQRSDSSSLTLADSYADDLTLGQSYTVKFISEIEEHIATIHEETYIADGEFGYVDENSSSFSVSSYYDQGSYIYYVEYYLYFMSKMSGYDLKIVLKDSNNSLIKTEMVQEQFDYEPGSTSEYMELSFEGNIETNVAGPYTVEVYATYGTEQLFYTTTVEEEVIPPYSFVDEPSVNFTAENGVLVMYYTAVVDGEESGSVRVEITDVVNKTQVYTQTFAVTPVDGSQAGPTGTSIYDNFNVDPDVDYELIVTSIINEKEEEIWNKIYTSSGDFAAILNNSSFSARYYADAQANVMHELNYDIYMSTELSGTNLTLKVFDTNETLITEELLAEVFTPAEADVIQKSSSLILDEAGPYVVKIYATFGKEHLLYTSNEIIEVAPEVYELDVEPEVQFFSDQTGNILMSFETRITPSMVGSLDVSIVDTDNSDTKVYENTFAINETGSEMAISDNLIIDVGHHYRLKMVSVINNNYAEIYNTVHLADGEFAHVSNDTSIEAITYTSIETGQTVHQIKYNIGFYADANGTDLTLRVYDSNESLLKEEVLQQSFSYSQIADEINGTFDVSAAGPYVVKLYATFGSEHLIYSTNVSEEAAPSYSIEESDVETRVYNDGGIYAEINVNFMADYAGQMYFELYNNSTQQLVSTSERHDIEINDAEKTYVEENFLIEDVSTSYTIKIYSVINDITVFVRDAFVNTNQEYGYASDLNVHGYNNNGVMVHEVTGTFYSEFACMVSASFTDESTGNVYYSNPVEIPAGEDYQFSTVLENVELTSGVTYDVRILANWGQGDVELENTNYMYEAVPYYGLSADIDNKVSDYEDETLTVLATITDTNGYLADIRAELTFPEMVSATSGNSFIASYDNSVGGFVFELHGVDVDSVGTIVITAIDANNNNVTITFVNTTIIY